jgi:hypothetical protein
VCCNADCSKLPGGNCSETGSVGQCKCNTDCGDAGSCIALYPDKDLDGHGDPNPTTMIVGCTDKSYPGYVTNNDDCDDTNKNVFPGQTAYFDSPRSNGSYDYNCDGKETLDPYYYTQPAACGSCPAPGCSFNTTCTSGTQSIFSCSPPIIFTPAVTPVVASTLTERLSINPGPIYQICYRGPTHGYTQMGTKCGAPTPYYTCENYCNSTGGYYGFASMVPYDCN